MADVNHYDQLLDNYSVEGQSRKWRKKVFPAYRNKCYQRVCDFSSMNPQIKSHRLHPYFRETFVHELMQLLLDARSDPNHTSHEQQYGNGRPVKIDSIHLHGKHFPLSQFHARKTCRACDCKKNANRKQSRKKTYNFCEKCYVYICKSCLEHYHTRSSK